MQMNNKMGFIGVTHQQQGSIVLYLLAGIAMLATITFYITQGVKEQRLNRQVTENVPMIINDLYKIESIINRCVLTYPDPIDVDADGDIDANDNPNMPYPVYNDLSSGGTDGDDLLDIKCPAAPTADNDVFKNQIGYKLAFLNNGNYDLNYLNSSTEGIRLQIHRIAGNDAWWSEARDRIDGKMSSCKTEVNTTVTPCDTGGGCIHFWIKRMGTSASVEPGCP